MNWPMLFTYFSNTHAKRLRDVLTVYISIKYDSRGIFQFNTMKNRRELYRKYEAYVIRPERNVTIRFYFNTMVKYPIIVEVSKSSLLFLQCKYYCFIMFFCFYAPFITPWSKI